MLPGAVKVVVHIIHVNFSFTFKLGPKVDLLIFRL